MVEKMWKVYGKNGHRQKASFEKSVFYDWSCEEDGTRKVYEINSDVTGTNDYCIVGVIRDTEKDCNDEFWGQVYDGIFENYNVGVIVTIDPNIKKYKELKAKAKLIWNK